MTSNFNPSRLARLAYHTMVENAATLQDEIIRQEAVNKFFGDDGLSVNKIRRGYQNNMRNGIAKRDITSMLQRHGEYIAALKEFEKLFEIEERNDAEAFAQAFRDRMKSDG